MKRFLVTGGAGFIGSHIVERLIRDGHFVRVLDNFSSGKKENLSFINDQRPTTNDRRRFELIKGDIRDPSACGKACKNIDFVLHHAALRSVPKSMSAPGLYNEVNIDGTLNMLLASQKNRVRHFVFASSSSIYGDIDCFPEKEDFAPRPISPYALTKLTGEHYCHIFSRYHGLSTTSLRYFNVFGPRQALDDEYAVVIPKFIHCILRDEQPPIFGTGRQSRDFTYVDNVVEANILAATRGLSPQIERDCPRSAIPSAVLKGTVPKKGDCPHNIFNIAGGQDISVLELVRVLNRLTGKKIKPLFLPPRRGDVFKTHADISAARRALGYRAVIDFKKGLGLTLAYFIKKMRAS
ncbi:MAG: SDR family oxidoreductase [Candidatus Omnitrophica bacterium]|nr:SDR family oxidoreductase [Candidatus Omnitrophota bacterium]